LKKGTLNRFANDYSDRNNHESIAQHLIDFDKKLIQMFNLRKERYTQFEHMESNNDSESDT
jgi:hypothetical protein